MKNKLNPFLIAIFAALFTLLGCVDKNFDTPTFEVPVADFDSTKLLTISGFINLAPELAAGSVFKVDSEYYVKCIFKTKLVV